MSVPEELPGRVPAAAAPAPDGAVGRPRHGELHLTAVWPALLYLVWGGMAWFGDVSGAVPLQPGTGWILTFGALLTTALFAGLARLPAPERPPAVTAMAAQSVMAIIWATLYSHFCAGDSWITPGMYLSAVVMTLPAAGPALVGWLAGAALLSFAALKLLDATTVGPGVGLAAAVVHVTALAAMLLAAWGTAYWLGRLRARQGAEVRRLRATLTQLSRRPERDELTRSYSRRYLLDLLAREKARADRTQESFCVCLLDIDHFQALNEQFGQPTGDRILAGFARRVRAELRRMDSLSRSGLELALGRLGAEEFLIALPGTSLKGALRCAERIRRAMVHRPFNGLHQVTVSIGIAEYQRGEDIDSLLARADAALEGARRGGRNRVHCAGPRGGGSAVVMPDIPAAS